MRVVIDTHVFLKRIVPEKDKFYVAFMKKNCKMVINTLIMNEYEGRATSHGYRVTDIYISLSKLKEKEKLIKKGMSACKTIEVGNRQIQKDAHLIRAAKASRAKYLITKDWDDLLAFEDKIKREFDIEVITPEEFLIVQS